MSTSAEIRAIPVLGIEEVRPNDSLVDALLSAASANDVHLEAGDIIVIKHKIVSKSEGRLIPLDSVKPSHETKRWAQRYHLDARVTQLAIGEAHRIVRKRRGVLITETHNGLVCANSGVDVSNVDGGANALLLPLDADRSAANLYRGFRKRLGFAIPVIISDSFGRPWREGLTEAAIGVAGMKVFRDFRQRRDRYGYKLKVSLEAVADELACVAGLVCEKLASTPACIVRGYKYEPGRGSARQIIRSRNLDLFR